MKISEEIKKLKVSMENLIKDIPYDTRKRMAQVTFCFALAPVLGSVTACTEEELLQAQHAIEQMTETPEVVETPEVIDEPETTIPVEEEPTVEIEPEVVEPAEEINPRDYSAVYDFDFEVPVYTEEEVEAARERLEENEDILNKISDGDDSEETLEAVREDYYIAHQAFYYELYNTIKDVNTSVLNTTENHGYCYDESTGWVYRIRNDIIAVYGKDSDGKYFSISCNTVSRWEANIAHYTQSNMLAIAPGTYISVNSNDALCRKYEHYCKEYEYTYNDYPSLIFSMDDLINNGLKSYNYNYEYSYKLEK